MKTENLPADFECNVDTANEEIQRLSAKLGVKTPEFVANIYDANEKIAELNAELVKKAEVAIRPPAKVNPAPKITDPPKPKVSAAPTRQQPEVTGLQRAINANVAKAGKPVHTTSSNYKPTGLFRAIEANIRDQKSKPKTTDE